MNDFSLKREQKFVLAALALAASGVALFVDAKGFLVDSLSAVVGFTAALMLAGPILRWFKRQTQLAAAIYVVDVRSSILDPTMRRSEQRMAVAMRGLTTLSSWHALSTSKSRWRCGHSCHLRVRITWAQ
jgi:hypothetical protein